MKLPASGKWSVSSEQYLVTRSGVKWAFNGQSSALENVGVDHGGFDILVPEQFLNSADTCPEPQVLGVVAVLQEMGGKGVTKCMRSHMLVNTCAAGSFLDGFLHNCFVKVMTADNASTLVFGEIGRGKQVLPDPFLICISIFAFESQREIDRPKSVHKVFLVDGYYIVELKFQRLDERIGKDGQAVILTLSIADNNLMVVKIYIFYSQAHGFHYTKSTSIHDLSYQFRCTGEVGKEAFDFIPGEDSRDGFGALRTEFREGEFVKFDLKNMAI